MKQTAWSAIPRRIGITRNLLLVLALICELVSVATLVVGTRPASEIASIDPIIEKMHGLVAAGTSLDRTISVVRSQDELLHRLNELARVLARVIGAIGFLLVILAWRVHRTVSMVTEGVTQGQPASSEPTSTTGSGS